MLAERRKKVIYSNPRGQLWAKDKNKYGQRLMESMGWKEGQGLGKQHNGIIENVKANFKFDNKGLGYKPQTKHWIEDNNVYEKILADLAKHHTVSNNENDTVTRSDLEQKTKKSGRLHYGKFIKSKNLSVKSDKDLFCIFPTIKNTDEQPKNKDNPKEVEKSIFLPEEETIQTVESKLSVEDYFKQKMKAKLGLLKMDEKNEQSYESLQNSNKKIIQNSSDNEDTSKNEINKIKKRKKRKVVE